MKKKNVIKKASVGVSLLMSSVLLCGNTVKAHAQADLTPEESQKLTEFLATQPTNGARTSLGLTNNVSHSNYTTTRTLGEEFIRNLRLGLWFLPYGTVRIDPNILILFTK